MSAKQRLRVHSGPQQTQQITGRAFRISFHLDWQIDDGIYNRPIIAHTRILVQRWRPRTMISALFRRRTFHLWYRLKTSRLWCQNCKFFRLCIKVGRGQGDRDACVRTWDLGTREEGLGDVKYRTRGRGDVKNWDAGDPG